ncbi:MAG: glycosyltransferase family 2 protein, partial [Planctomycetota bacterium]|nr:glycosyltransferase family 2 protein [Planctomycetota bacterium]
MSDERPLLSILVPTLNRRSWLEQCLDSVVPQLTEDCELLVGNNCSDDDTALLEKRYQHPRIRWINFTERLPMKHNWQRLVDRAQGTWFILLSDDDKLAPDAIHFLHTLLPITKSDII